MSAFPVENVREKTVLEWARAKSALANATAKTVFGNGKEPTFGGCKGVRVCGTNTKCVVERKTTRCRVFVERAALFNKHYEYGSTCGLVMDN